jgi:PmbA protein
VEQDKTLAKVQAMDQDKDRWAATETEGLLEAVQYILKRSREAGASAAEVGASMHTGLSVTVRLGEVETLEHSRDRGIGITVYKGQHKGSASCGDLSRESIDTSIEMACSMAGHTEADSCSGLADPELMASDFPELDLWHPWDLEPEAAIDLAREMEAGALEYDPKITNSEGATVNSGLALSVYGNTHGFVGQRQGSSHSLSCVAVTGDEQGMQRDYWYDSRRAAGDLQDHQEIGQMAAQRALRRQGAKSLPTQQAPVLFAPEVARSLLGHLVSAVSGGNLYRKSSFLLDQLDKQIFPEFVTIEEQPFEPRGLRSTHFDSEGVAPRLGQLVSGGRLASYILGSYSARKLGMQSTGNAGGTHNLTLTGGELDASGMLREMGRGLLVTEMMGHGVSVVTGDYSRGATGFWVEDGELAFPVEGVTVASNLKDMFMGIKSIGNDIDYRSGVRCGSILVGQMTVAGQ